ncbi:hypothetical protein D3C85_928410 [compost metagenome]
MANAHVICPAFFSSSLRSPEIYNNILLGKFLFSPDQIVLDREERIILSYLEAVKSDAGAFMNYKAWKTILDQADNGKKLVSTSLGATDNCEIIFNTISQAITPHDKAIVVHDYNHYSAFISEINKQRINMLSLHDLKNITPYKRFRKLCGYEDFEKDLYWTLHRTGRFSKKNWSEDNCNDFLREILLSKGQEKGYEVKDQSREGLSESRAGAGELDILIENDGLLYTILEAMKLSSLDKDYINKHYKKLLVNYNPLNVPRTYLITYYTGANFSNWWERYKTHIESISPAAFTTNEASRTEKVESVETEYGNLKQIRHYIRSDSHISICTHLGLKIEE